jgi:hypothetical protein
MSGGAAATNQHMNTTALPTIQTQLPSQTGLVLHEIIANSLIHAAAVFGIEQDERFVERVATMAWFNGAFVILSKAPSGVRHARQSLLALWLFQSRIISLLQ